MSHRARQLLECLPLSAAGPQPHPYCGRQVDTSLKSSFRQLETCTLGNHDGGAREYLNSDCRRKGG